ncbi:hypothetical protein [Actinokineospora enzanensis]|uniref:hypothetical protein n=1 Tax=Actinokineospora enzanensis TaxID=155975 RepID=UPI000376EEB2|nr:hypothetical protein [Actinokineospora enzanensis]
MARALLIGFDPFAVSHPNAAEVAAALETGMARFAELGLEGDLCSITAFDTAEATIVEALAAHPYACVVIGGGIRKSEHLLEFFEQVLNLVHRHAPQAAIAFNTNPLDSADAARRWVS